MSASTEKRGNPNSPSFEPERLSSSIPNARSGSSTAMCTRRSRRPHRPSNRFTTCSRLGCSRLFAVCGSCDRGTRYCSEACATLVRRAQTRLAGKRYQASERGRRAHAARQARYRSRSRRPPSVTHQSRACEPDSRTISFVAGSVRCNDRGVRVEAAAPRARKVPPEGRCPQQCAFCGRGCVFLRVAFYGRSRAPRASESDLSARVAT